MKPYALNPCFEYRDIREMLQGSADTYGDDVAYSYRYGCTIPRIQKVGAS